MAVPHNPTRAATIILFGAVGKCIRGGQIFMTARATNIQQVERFLARVVGALKDPHGPRPYLCLNKHPAYKSALVQAGPVPFRVLF